MSIISEEVAIQLHTVLLLKETYIYVYGESKHWLLEIAFEMNDQNITN